MNRPPINGQTVRAKIQAVERSQGAATALSLLEGELSGVDAGADIWNFAGNVAMRAQHPARAAELFGKAYAAEPASLEYAINCGIAHSASGNHNQALAILAKHSDQGANNVRYCSTRANAARSSGYRTQAAHWYDRALALEPRHVRAMNGRARTALERAEPDALQRFDDALRTDAGNADLWLGKAQALDVVGDNAGARTIAQQLVDQAPHWIEALRFLAQLRLGAGEEDFTSHYADAAKKMPQDPNILNDWIAQLAGLDYASKAATVAVEAQRQFPDQPHFILLEAINAGAAGDDDRAEAIFAQLAIAGPDRQLYEARHRIRRGEFDAAQGLLDGVINVDPWNISAWALRGIVWRCLGDDRAHWLHGQDGLYRSMPLDDADGALSDVLDKLHGLHNNSPLPLGQSLRGGTQTRGNLFDRVEPELVALNKAIMRTITNFQAQMPDYDATHPLLRHRNNAMAMAGSWSVRLSGGGDHHTSHIHPQGIISSALYCQFDHNHAQNETKPGWLEIGRPPPDLRLDLEPIAAIEPKAGYLALFPSTLYHGTRPFGHDQRMTVAFDVVSSE